MLKHCQLYACPNGTLGLHLSRAPWDPYPWVSAVQDGSGAQRAGVLNGDTVLEMNGRDVLGQKISQIAEYIGEHWRSGAAYVSVLIWRNQADSVTVAGEDEQETSEHNIQQQQQQQQQQHQRINQQSLQKFATCLQHIAQLLECPVCLEVIRPPGWQCCNGHVLCNNCRSRSVKCPVCRVPLGPRGRCLMSDKLFILLAESFPCDGGKCAEYFKNNNSHKIANNNLPAEVPRRRKSYQDFSKQVKMATFPKENTIKLEKLAKDQVKYEDIMKETSSRQVDEDAGGKVVEVSENEQKSRMKETVGHMEKLGQLETNHRPYNSNSISNNITRICLRRTSKEREHQQSKDEHEILKSQKENFCHNGFKLRNANSDNKSKNCTRAPTAAGQTVATSIPVIGTSLTSLSLSSCRMKSNDVERNAAVVASPAATAAVEVRNTDAFVGGRWTLKELEMPKKMTKELKSNKNNNNNENDDDDDNVIVKLKLKFKSNEKSRDCMMDNSSNKLGYSNNNNKKVIALENDKKFNNNTNNNNSSNSTLRKSHEIQAADRVVASANRSSSTTTQTITTITTTTTARRMMLQQQQQQQKQVAQQQHQQNYYCPTGKSCCCYVQSSTRATLTSAMCAKVAATAMNKCLSTSSETNNNNNNNKEHVAKIANVEKSLKDVQQPVEAVTAAPTTITTINLSYIQAAAIDAIPNTADSSIARSATTTHNNCNCNQKVPATATTRQLFEHLTEVHHVAVSHYYGVFGTRIRVSLMQSKLMMPCLNVSHPVTDTTKRNSEAQQFLLARIPLPPMTFNSSCTTQEIAAHNLNGNASKYAIFLWHLNQPVTDAAAAVTHNYETIIESSRSRVRWFGSAHALSQKCWSQIQAEGHFMLHAAATATATAQQVIALRSWEQRQDAVAVIGTDDDDDFFDIVIKIK